MSLVHPPFGCPVLEPPSDHRAWWGESATGIAAEASIFAHSSCRHRPPVETIYLPTSSQLASKFPSSLSTTPYIPRHISVYLLLETHPLPEETPTSFPVSLTPTSSVSKLWQGAFRPTFVACEVGSTTCNALWPVRNKQRQSYKPGGGQLAPSVCCGTLSQACRGCFGCPSPLTVVTGFSAGADTLTRTENSLDLLTSIFWLS